METLFAAAKKRIPSGVNSPVRAFQSVGGSPVFVRKGKGPFIWDAKGKKYLDFCCSWGPLIFGHAPAGLLKTVKQALDRGTSFGAATEGEVKAAQKIHSLFPSMEKVRLVSSGTEAVMSAIRLARGYTGRKKILKLDGGYHGHVDSLLIKAGSGVATFGIPDSAGVPKELAGLTLSIPFNDTRALETIFKKHGRDIAAMILEPVPANMGVVPPAAGYLKKVRALTRRYGALLIFDEVITGFRVSRGGAQELFGIRPDLTCLGKILGGGFPLAAFGGAARIMDYLAPAGPVYQAGTLSGNPLAVSASIWMLDHLRPRSVHQALNRKAEKFIGKLRKMMDRSGKPWQVNSVGSMFTIFFSMKPVTDYGSAKAADAQAYARFFHACLKQGLYLAPSQFEANFVSTAHSEKDLERALRIFEQAL